MEKKVKNKTEAIKQQETVNKAEKTRLKLLKEINYTSLENTYSFEFEKKTYTFKGFPSIIEKAKIKAILNTIAPHSLCGGSAEVSIYGSGDISFSSYVKATTHIECLLLSPEGFDPDSFFSDKNGEVDSGRLTDFGFCVLMSEIEFKESKKKQS